MSHVHFEVQQGKLQSKIFTYIYKLFFDIKKNISQEIALQ